LVNVCSFSLFSLSLSFFLSFPSLFSLTGGGRGEVLFTSSASTSCNGADARGSQSSIVGIVGGVENSSELRPISVSVPVLLRLPLAARGARPRDEPQGAAEHPRCCCCGRGRREKKEQSESLFFSSELVLFLDFCIRAHFF